jgi:hypothetical protein
MVLEIFQQLCKNNKFISEKDIPRNKEELFQVLKVLG